MADIPTYTALPPTVSRFRIKRPRSVVMILLGISIAVIATICVTMIVYLMTLSPMDTSSNAAVRVIIKPGNTASDIADTLKSHDLIRSKETFNIYVQLTGTKSKLRAGGYLLKKSQSVQQIVDHLVLGKTDEMSVTILPGLTLEQLADPSISGSLAAQGFTADEISRAFSATYSSPLFLGKPPGTSLEGYIYPETYKVAVTDSLESILKMTFAQFYDVMQKNNTETSLKTHNLSLYQGITLASIVQKEVASPVEQRHVAQVFLKRLDEGIVLGSDVTFLYIAKKEGREPSVNDPSPYNTRRAAGLPPGPIANFNFSALQAVMNPASGDYLYFVAGDDGTTYYAKTEAEHDANVSTYCKRLCQ